VRDPTRREAQEGREGLLPVVPQVQLPQAGSGRRMHHEGRRAQAQGAPGGNRQKGAEAPDATHHDDRMPQVRQQHRLRLAGPNPRSRRKLNPVLQMHKMQLHIQRILINFVHFQAES